ncbi:MAG: DUF4180 domain-containing protein [Pseudomonadota bacterium]
MATPAYARDLGVSLHSPQDALNALSCGEPGCIFELSDLHEAFFDLKNGLAGEVFQKFTNYRFRAAFVVPEPERMGPRVVELCRDHERHPFVRLFSTKEAAQQWLGRLQQSDQEQQ